MLMPLPMLHHNLKMVAGVCGSSLLWFGEKPVFLQPWKGEGACGLFVHVKVGLNLQWLSQTQTKVNGYGQGPCFPNKVVSWAENICRLSGCK